MYGKGGVTNQQSAAKKQKGQRLGHEGGEAAKITVATSTYRRIVEAQRPATFAEVASEASRCNPKAKVIERVSKKTPAIMATNEDVVIKRALFNPTKAKLNIKNVRNFGTNGVVIEAASEVNLKAILNNKEIEKAGSRATKNREPIPE